MINKHVILYKNYLAEYKIMVLQTNNKIGNIIPTRDYLRADLIIIDNILHKSRELKYQVGQKFTDEEIIKLIENQPIKNKLKKIINGL